MPTLIEMDGYVQGISSSSVTIGTGAQRFILGADEPFEAGMEIEVNDGTENNTLSGTVTSYNSGTKELVLNIVSIAGSGTLSNWIIGGTRTFRFSDTGYKTKLTDTPSGVHYTPMVQDSGNFEQYLFSPGTTFGNSSIGKGDIILQNASGVIDYLRKIGVNKRALRIKLRKTC